MLATSFLDSTTNLLIDLCHCSGHILKDMNGRYLRPGVNFFTPLHKLFKEGVGDCIPCG